MKPNPPVVEVLAEVNFSTSLLVIWKHDIDETTMKFSHGIRYCQVGSSDWKKVLKKPRSFSLEFFLS